MASVAPSKIPFLIKGLLDWMSEADLTPYLVVNANHVGVEVPKAFVQADGTITLNLSGHAVRHLTIESDGIAFDSRFQGQPHSIWVPLNSVLGLVSRETSDGLWFPENQPSNQAKDSPNTEVAEVDARSADNLKAPSSVSGKDDKPRGRPNLTIVE